MKKITTRKWGNKVEDLSQFVGHTITKFEIVSKWPRFTLSNGGVFEFHHSQDCCEQVGFVENETPDLSHLTGLIVKFEERTEDGDGPPAGWYGDACEKWTFYEIATSTGGSETLRFFGSSNGYYSVDVDVVQVKAPVYEEEEEWE